MVNAELKKYIEENVFPKYERFYSHGMLHINAVIENSLMLAKYYGLDENMCFTIAAYHDSGLGVDRKNHEKEGGKILRADEKLRKFFSEEQIETMAEAVEDHRGSRKTRPRSIYGEVVSDSDRDFDLKILAKRQLATSIKNYPDLSTSDEHFERCYEYLSRRITEGGHFNLWTNNSILKERRAQFEREFLNKDFARKIYADEWEQIHKDGTFEKIKDYYLDF